MSQLKTADVVTITVMDRTLKIKCPTDKITALQEAANYLDKKMQEIYHNDKFATIDRIAITVALNVTYDLLHSKQQPGAVEGHTHKADQNRDININKSLQSLKNKIHQSLDSHKL